MTSPPTNACSYLKISARRDGVSNLTRTRGAALRHALKLAGRAYLAHGTTKTKSALDAFTTRLTENYPLDIHADSVQITYDGVTPHYSNRDTSIPQGNQGNQGNKNNQEPCFANL